MTVYELIKDLVDYPANAEVIFKATGNLLINGEAKFDRKNKNDIQDVTVSGYVNDHFDFDDMKLWEHPRPQLEILLKY